MSNSAPRLVYAVRSGSWAWGLLVALLTTLWTLPVRADTVRFVWVRGERTEGCSEPAAVAQAVTQRLGKSVFSGSAQRSIEAVIQHEGEVWEAHIYTRDVNGKLNGSRLLTSRDPTCASIEAAATLAIALAIDPDAALRAPPASPPPSGIALPAAPAPPGPLDASTPPPAPCRPMDVAPPPVCPAPPPAPPPPPPCPVERPCPSAGKGSSPPPSAGAIALRAVVGFGLLPAPSPGFALSTDLRVHRRIHGTAGVLYLPDQRTGGGGYSFGLTAAWFGACARPWESSSGTGSLSLCADAMAGGIHSVVFALEPVNPGERAWAGGLLEAVLRLRVVGPLEAEVGADLVIPFTRYKFAVEQQAGTVFQESQGAALCFAGAGASFP